MKTMDDQNHYQSTFIEYVISGVQEALERVRAAEPLPDEHDRQFAWHILSYAFNFAEAWPCTRELLLALAPKMEQAGFREDWMLYLEQGVRQSQALNDQSIAAECQLQIGMLYRLQSKFDLARQQLTASVAGFAALHAAHDQARALNELAWLDYLQQRYQAATDHAEQTLALLGADDAERGMSYRVLGMMATDHEQWQEAECYHRQALAAFEAGNDVRKIVRGLANLASCLLGQGKLQESISNYKQVATKFDELGDVYHLAVVQMNLGITYYKQEEPNEAVNWHLKADAIFRKLYDKINLAHNCTNLGKSHLALDAFTEAEKSFLEAMGFYEELGKTGWYLNAMDGLAMTFLADQRYEQAIATLKRALTILPTLQGSANYAYLHRSLNEHFEQAKTRSGAPNQTLLNNY